ncbi:hypothetical protein JOD31_001149 [Methylopila capsulata]|uniref:Uncharacterized protein n=1 Tax=Methylopila capsulata TaxID=61654 RepID=A0A9W6MQ98_9HYPH|nr:hypothetical protein [Methylopila capsulata]MBM7850924.1 hypothetical protein [Methylopila capsulata]GLK53982.1 hypothetical protein GCM10008170_00010 [Methylopila capsulata]
MSFKRVSDDQNNLVRRPGTADHSLFAHPDEVMDDPRLPPAEKRAILAAWASDRYAIEEAPGLRQLESGAIVPLDAIRAALCALNLAEPPRAVIRRAAPRRFRFRRRRANLRVTQDRSPDDDPPPPKPVRMRLRVA